MSEYFRFYAIANIVCLIIFGIMFLHDLLSIDRQEKQILFDHTLGAFMLYFISDIFFAAIISGIIPKTAASVALVNLANAILMAVITYSWFRYALAVEQVPYRNNQAFQIIAALPLALSIIVTVFMYIIDPSLFFDKAFEKVLISFRDGNELLFAKDFPIEAASIKDFYKNTNSTDSPVQGLSADSFTIE